MEIMNQNNLFLFFGQMWWISVLPDTGSLPGDTGAVLGDTGAVLGDTDVALEPAGLILHSMAELFNYKKLLLKQADLDTFDVISSGLPLLIF